jgi:hypothetical protein
LCHTNNYKHLPTDLIRVGTVDKNVKMHFSQFARAYLENKQLLPSGEDVGWKILGKFLNIRNMSEYNWGVYSIYSVFSNGGNSRCSLSLNITIEVVLFLEPEDVRKITFIYDSIAK